MQEKSRKCNKAYLTTGIGTSLGEMVMETGSALGDFYRRPGEIWGYTQWVITAVKMVPRKEYRIPQRPDIRLI